MIGFMRAANAENHHKMVISGPPIPFFDLQVKLMKARPGATKLERKRDELLLSVLRQAEQLNKGHQ